MMVFWTAFCMCVSMFTVLPAPRAAWNDELTPLRTACLPLVGLLIGALWLGIALAFCALVFYAVNAYKSLQETNGREEKSENTKKN